MVPFKNLVDYDSKKMQVKIFVMRVNKQVKITYLNSKNMYTVNPSKSDHFEPRQNVRFRGNSCLKGLSIYKIL